MNQNYSSAQAIPNNESERRVASVEYRRSAPVDANNVGERVEEAKEFVRNFIKHANNQDNTGAKEEWKRLRQFGEEGLFEKFLGSDDGKQLLMRLGKLATNYEQRNDAGWTLLLMLKNKAEMQSLLGPILADEVRKQLATARDSKEFFDKHQIRFDWALQMVRYMGQLSTTNLVLMHEKGFTKLLSDFVRMDNLPSKINSRALQAVWTISRLEMASDELERLGIVDWLLSSHKITTEYKEFLRLLILVYFGGTEKHERIMEQMKAMTLLYNRVAKDIKDDRKRMVKMNDLLEAIKALAIGDFFQHEFSRLGGLDKILSILEDEYNVCCFRQERERLYDMPQQVIKQALGALWRLLFNPKSQQYVTDKVGDAFWPWLEFFYNRAADDGDHDLETTVHNIYLLMGKSRAQLMKRRMTESKQTDRSMPENYVVLSYSWAQQKKVLKILKHLKDANINAVLTDVEQEGTRSMEGSSKVIDGCRALLFCVSRNYAKSANCRMELEYAARGGRPLIPLLMEPNFKPSGWLAGHLAPTGSQFSFTNEEEWEESIERLRQALKPSNSNAGPAHHHNKNEGIPGASSHRSVSSVFSQRGSAKASSSKHSLSRSGISDMNSDALMRYLKSKGFSTEQFIKHEWDGQSLMASKTLWKHDPYKFVNLMKFELGMSFGKALAFGNLVDKSN